MPAARPEEIFLYATPLSVSALRRPQSAGALLADWAVKAGKASELEQALSRRKNPATAGSPGAILRGQLALALNDPVATGEALKVIAARLKTDTTRNTAELACHVAIPALYRPQAEIAKAALGVLDSAVKGMETTNQPEPLASLLLILARRQLQMGDTAGGRSRLDGYLAAADKLGIRYSGDYPLYLRKQQLERIAAEYAHAGLARDALATLGRFVDAPVYSGGDPPIGVAVAQVLGQLAAAPAGEEYEALRDWSMPTKDRRAIRVLTMQAARDTSPAVFAQPEASRGSAGTSNASGERPRQGDQTDALVSTATALVAAARRAGAIDQLAEAAAPRRTEMAIKRSRMPRSCIS